MGSWPVQDAKAKFSEFLDTTLRDGPQTVTRRGVRAAVLVPYPEWERLHRAAQPGIKHLLLEAGPRIEQLVPERPRWKRRKPLKF